MNPLREPLVHFLVLGGALFAVDALRDPGGAPQAGKERIVISSGRIDHLASMFAKTWQRPPTGDELQGLIDDFVLEEFYYRKALELGLDRDDTLIRRRMRQKLEFLTDDVAAMTPTEEELASYLAEHPDPFREEPRYRLRQVFIDPEEHDEPRAVASEFAERLRAGEEIEGDPTLLPGSIDRISPRGLDRQFGLGFAEQLAGLEVGRWSDPLESSYGLHLILVEERTPGRLPELDEVRDAVEREWAHERTQATRRAFNEELRSQYDITVEWPEPVENDE